MPDLSIGAPMGEWLRDTGFETWNRYAAVNYEFVPIHMDDEAGRAAGMPGAFGPGNMLVTYLHGAVREWMGASGRITALSAQFRQPNTKGKIRIGGTVTGTSVDERGTCAEVELWIRDSDGNSLAPGTASVAFGHPPNA